jgi:hypothetical protein
MMKHANMIVMTSEAYFFDVDSFGEQQSPDRSLSVATSVLVQMKATQQDLPRAESDECTTANKHSISLRTFCMDKGNHVERWGHFGSISTQWVNRQGQ